MSSGGPGCSDLGKRSAARFPGNSVRVVPRAGARSEAQADHPPSSSFDQRAWADTSPHTREGPTPLARNGTSDRLLQQQESTALDRPERYLTRRPESRPSLPASRRRSPVRGASGATPRSTTSATTWSTLRNRPRGVTTSPGHPWGRGQGVRPVGTPGMAPGGTLRAGAALRWTGSHIDLSGDVGPPPPAAGGRVRRPPGPPPAPESGGPGCPQGGPGPPPQRGACFRVTAPAPARRGPFRNRCYDASETGASPIPVTAPPEAAPPCGGACGRPPRSCRQRARSSPR